MFTLYGIQYMYTVYKANVVDLNLDGLLSILWLFS